MHMVTVDCSGVTSISEFWQRYLDAVRPEGAHLFGRNLDAFWDAVEGGGPGAPKAAVLVLEHSHALACFQTSTGQTFLDALKQVGADATQIDIRFA